jgi:sugar phosphate isomerase/epimerase
VDSYINTSDPENEKMTNNYEVKFAYNTLVYAGEDITESIHRLARYGYDGVEFIGEPDELDRDRIKMELQSSNISASSICSLYNSKRDLVSTDREVRKNTVEYIKKNVLFASDIQAEVVIVSPTACMKTKPETSLNQEWAWAVEGIREAAEFAQDYNVVLVVEAWNRYETYLINRLDQSMKMVDDVGMDNVGSMGDTFHMNIEEEDMAQTIRNAKGYLKHIHFADSTRSAPGHGHIDFGAIASAIKDIGYRGYVSMELLPAAADPFMVLAGGKGEEFYDEYTEQSIAFVKRLF